MNIMEMHGKGEPTRLPLVELVVGSVFRMLDNGDVGYVVRRRPSVGRIRLYMEHQGYCYVEWDKTLLVDVLFEPCELAAAAVLSESLREQTAGILRRDFKLVRHRMDKWLDGLGDTISAAPARPPRRGRRTPTLFLVGTSNDASSDSRTNESE